MLRMNLGARSWCAGLLLATLWACARPSPPSPPPPDPLARRRASLVADGDAAFAKRDQPARAEEAIAFWSEAAHWRDGADVRVRLARAHHFLAQRDRATAREQYARAAQEALRALELEGVPAADRCAEKADAKLAPAIYWRAEGLEGWSREVGLVASGQERRTAFCLAKRAAQLEPAFFHAGPLRALGRQLASTPALAGGSLLESRKAFDRAREMAPRFLGTPVDFAATWAVKAQDREAFETALQQVLAAPPGALPEVEPENELAKERARRLLERADELF